jgi:hypothetical protein
MKESKEVNVYMSLNEMEAQIFITMCYERIEVLAARKLDTASIQAYARCIERIAEEIVKNKIKVSE